MTATDRVYGLIRRGIVAGTYGAGEPLREEELAAAAGVSRTPVREALRRLGAEGLVEMLPNRGARVAGWSAHDLEEIFELRVELEGHGARLAALHATPGAIEQLRTCCGEMEGYVAGGRPDRLERITECNNAFHQGLLAAGGNRRLASVLAAIVQRALVERTFHLYRPEELARSCAHHREVLDALAAGDPEWAEAVMRAHILAGRRVAESARSLPEPADSSPGPTGGVGARAGRRGARA